MARRSGGARQGTRYYRGRTTQTSSEQSKLRKQKEYRRKKLSKQKRLELKRAVVAKLRWLIAFTILLQLFNLLQIKSHTYTGLTGMTDGDKQVVSQLTDDYLSGANRFKTFLNTQDYERHIAENASFVSSVEASTSLFSTTLNVRVTPKTPIYKYNGTDSNSTQWLAQDGSLISLTEDQIADIGSTRPDITVVDSSGIDYLEGESVLPLNTLEFMGEVWLELQLLGVETTAFELSQTPRELRLSLEGEKYKLILNSERPVQSIIADYKATIELLKTKNQLPQQYIDLSVVDKTFYR